MNRDRFDVAQSTHAVVDELFLLPSKRLERGQQFTMTLVVTIEGEDSLPLDIYVDRTNSALEEVIDGSKRVRTQASVEPGGEQFALEITFNRDKDLHTAHPEVRVSSDMRRLLREYRDRRDAEGVDAFLRSLDLE